MPLIHAQETAANSGISGGDNDFKLRIILASEQDNEVLFNLERTQNG